jgi:bromodomain and PHD finger-containing protein 1
VAEICENETKTRILESKNPALSWLGTLTKKIRCFDVFYLISGSTFATMGLDFDLHGFIEDMKACKGPYKCPYRDCGKVYKTYSGIHGHIMSHTNGGSTAGSGSRTPICPSSGRRSPVDSQPFFKSPLKETLFFNEADKTVEFESSEGSLQRLSVYDALELVSKEDWEATLSPSAYEPDKKQEEVPKTPTTSRPFYKKGKKTPKGSNKPDAAAEAKRTEGADNDRKILKLPEAHFVEIEDYDIEDAPPMPTSYFRFIEKPAEEQVSDRFNVPNN